MGRERIPRVRDGVLGPSRPPGGHPRYGRLGPGEGGAAELHAGQQHAAGSHTLAWDGLDRDGQPVPNGEYTWKLLQTQGLTAEFLFNLGTSTYHHHWPSQHLGPAAVAVDGQDFFSFTGMSEGMPYGVRCGFDGTVHWQIKNPEAWMVTGDIALDNGGIWWLATNSFQLYRVDARNGSITKAPPPDVLLSRWTFTKNGASTAEKIDHMPAPQGEAVWTKNAGIMSTFHQLTLDVPADSHYLVGITYGSEDSSSPALRLTGTADGRQKTLSLPATQAGEFTTSSPRQFQPHAFQGLSAHNGKLEIGVHTDELECASVKTMPCEASRSTCGVGILLCSGSRQPISP